MGDGCIEDREGIAAGIAATNRSQFASSSDISLRPQTGPGRWSVPSSSIRPRECGKSRAQELRGDPNHVILIRLGLYTVSAHGEMAGVAMPFPQCE